jgi:Uma2 family endonuclease
LTPRTDDGIVVGKGGPMGDRTSTVNYLRGTETTRRRELIWGVVREPPAPKYGHQATIMAVSSTLYRYVLEHQLGDVVAAPIDVVLDADRGLVVQPDVVFISAARRAIIGDRIRGAPDLVVEVLSPRTARRDRTVKVGWYRRYGVAECWLIDDSKRRVDVINWSAGRETRTRFLQDETLVSTIVAGFRLPLADIF